VYEHLGFTFNPRDMTTIELPLLTIFFVTRVQELVKKGEGAVHLDQPCRSL
jgi:hypothetical protein